MYKYSLSLEAPFELLAIIDPLVDFHFCIATEAIKDSRYLEFFRDSEKPVMLDNGTYEEGFPLSPEELFDVAKEIRPQIVWAPDYWNDSKKTLEKSMSFIALSERKWQVGVIPQGRTVEELWESAYSFRACNIFGFSFKHPRAELIEALQASRFFTQPHVLHVHMLGIRHIEEVLSWPIGHFDISTDTSKAVKASIFEHKIEDCPRGLGKWHNLNWTKTPPDFYKLLYRNIAKLHTALTR